MSEPTPTTVEKPPRKWLGPAGGWLIFGAMLLFWLINLLWDQLVAHRIELSPNTLALGGFGMASAFIYTMAYRLRPADGVTPLRLVLAFLFGGLFSSELALFLEIFVGYIPAGSSGNQALVVRELAGVIEEACKLLAVVIAARGLTVRNARTGLFMGGAVGFGFAAFEDMRYAYGALAATPHSSGQFLAVAEVTIGRDIIGPLEHPIMSAFLAAALFAASRNGRFRVTTGVVGVYLVVAAVHGLIDTVPYLVQESVGGGAGGLLGTAIDLVLAIGLGIAWLVYTRRLRRRMIADDALNGPVAA